MEMTSKIFEMHPKCDEFHENDFKVIEELSGVSTDGAEAILKSQDEIALIDGGLQVVLLWAKHILGGATLPTHIEQIVIGEKPLSLTNVQCTVVARSSNNSKTISDVTFSDSSGSRIAELRGVETHLRPTT